MGRQSDALVLFGATSDLAKRKLLPAIYQLALAGRLDLPVGCVALPTLTGDQFQQFAEQAIRAAFPAVDERVLAEVLSRLAFIPGDCTNPATFAEIVRQLRGARRPAHFLAIPPSLVGSVVEQLAAAGLQRDATLLVEKPFGHDLASARALDASLRAVFAEESILRVEHYLGKESIENLLVLRFGNPFFQPVWHRDHIASVQLTHCESRGVQTRGASYEGVGAIRDVIQSHLLQLMALVAIRPPTDASAEALHAESLRVLRATRSVDPDRVVRGQYSGYQRESGVAPDSTVETYAAMRLAVDLPEWAGVPFFLRSGKGLAATAIEAVVDFKPTRRPFLFGADVTADPAAAASRVRFRVGADPGVTVTVDAKRPGPHRRPAPTDLHLDLDAVGTSWESYAHLLEDALHGDRSRFARAEAVEESWRIVAPGLAASTPPIRYDRGSWGPPAADRLLDGDSWCLPATAT